MLQTAPRRLPGFSFQVQAPPATDVLPRMDVAAFVGFAASGPLQTPVPVEDAAQFAAIFGDDLPLAWDRQRGEQIYAYLAPAVRAFFRNGGRRCWVVRVAAGAQPNYFPIPGLVQLHNGEATPAFAQARSEGSWSDGLRSGAALLARPISVTRADADLASLDVAVDTPDGVAPGDLLRLTFSAGDPAAGAGLVLLFSVQDAGPFRITPDSPSGSASGSRGSITVTGAALASVWLDTRPPGSAPALPDHGDAYLFTGGLPAAAGSPAPAGVPALLRRGPLPAQIDWAPAGAPPGTVAIDLPLSLNAAPEPGSLVRVDLGPAELWLTVATAGAVGAGVRLAGPGTRRLAAPPVPLPAGLPAYAERLSFEMWVLRGNANPQRLGQLAFGAGSPRFWADLPTDAQIYANPLPSGAPAPETSAVWQAAAQPRFPLAGGPAGDSLFFPAGMSSIPAYFLSAAASDRSPLQRDGLSRFGAALFLDPDLVSAGTATLLARADFVRYQSPDPRPLLGIHTILGVDEATIIAVPDAVHPGWQTAAPDPLPDPDPQQPLPRPGWWRFRDCANPGSLPLVAGPPTDHFLACGLQVIPAPVLTLDDRNAQVGTYNLSWTPVPGAAYILEEAPRPDWSAATVIYAGPATSLAFYGRGQGDYYYRVRAELGADTSDWSNPAKVRVASRVAAVLNPAHEAGDSDLFGIHRALLRMCAARGDVFAVLTLPAWYRQNEGLAHAGALQPLDDPGQPPAAGLPGLSPLPSGLPALVVAPLGTGEAPDLSFGAIYHPWLISRQAGLPGGLRRTPPDGAACGVMAQRALNRGAWVAPANEPLADVVGLDPGLDSVYRLALQEGQINLFRQEARGFVVLDADTLSRDPDFRPLNVRRLLSLLRRLALSLGAIYVFEPNDDAFQRLVHGAFSQALGGMFRLGAFAGATAATSFQVSTPVTPADMDAGRFTVELRVAPSVPMRFLTIRLVQTAERSTVTEGR